MKYCNKCGVNVSGNHENCPLCKNRLVGNGEFDTSYPTIKRSWDIMAFVNKLLIAASIAGVAICAIIDYAVTLNDGWWLYVLGGVISFWIIYRSALFGKRNVSKSVMISTVSISLVCLIWDLLTFKIGWALDFVFPIACSSAMVCMAVVSIVMKLHIEQYIYYIIIDLLFGLIPLILLLCGAINIVLPTILCIGISLISLLALWIFEGKALKAEIIRRTHM